MVGDGQRSEKQSDPLGGSFGRKVAALRESAVTSLTRRQHEFMSRRGDREKRTDRPAARVNARVFVFSAQFRKEPRDDENDETLREGENVREATAAADTPTPARAS